MRPKTEYYCPKCKEKLVVFVRLEDLPTHVCSALQQTMPMYVKEPKKTGIDS